MPQSAAELAADSVACARAGAFAVHVHPRDDSGAQSLQAAVCDAAVAAIRAAAPTLPVGLSTSATIDPDPFARAGAIGRWRTPPDFVSVNLSEIGWPGIIRAALHAGIGVEAGLSSPEQARELASGAFAHRLVRVLVEVDGGVEQAQAIAEQVPDGVEQLWHGSGPGTWEVIAAGAALGHHVRVGFEDVLVGADGSSAVDNAELVAGALALIAA